MFKLQNILSPVRKSKYLFLSSGSHPLLSKSSQQISPNLCKQAIYSDHPGPPRTPLGHFRSSYQSIGLPPTVLIGLPPIVLTTSQPTWVRSSSKQITTRKQNLFLVFLLFLTLLNLACPTQSTLHLTQMGINN